MARRGGDTLAFAKRKDHSEAKEPAEGVSASLDHTDGLEARVTGRRLSGRSPVPGERRWARSPRRLWAVESGWVVSQSLTIHKPGSGLPL